MSESKKHKSIPHLLMKVLMGHLKPPPLAISLPTWPLNYSTNDERTAWRAYWQARGQSWRTEPEIEKKRQEYLVHRKATSPNVERGIYPYIGVKLDRADIEWVLANHENGRGPIDWNDKSQRERQELDLRGADLRGEDLRYLPLAHLLGGLSGLTFEWSSGTLTTVDRSRQAAVDMRGALLGQAHPEGAILRDAFLEGAFLDRTHLEGADLKFTRLQEAHLEGTHLEGASLYAAHLEESNLYTAHLEGAVLDSIFLVDEKCVSPLLADAEWGNDNLSVVGWSQIHMLGDEYLARSKKQGEEVKERARRLEDYEVAVRANRQVAIALQAQGLNEDAEGFAYRAQELQRAVLWQQRKFGKYLFSLFLSLISGYGYKLWRSFASYTLVIVGFAVAYYLLGPIAKLPLSPLDAIVFSLTSFHGRGFSPGENIGLSNPLTVLAAIEAFVGLVIEITLIATLTQRFFGK